MDVCVLGNSHVAMLREAGTPAVAPTYFAAPRRTVASLEPREGVLVSPDARVRGRFRRTSGGAEAIVPERFDAFVVVGLTGPVRVLHECSAHRTLGDAVDRRAPLISEACFRDVIRGHVAAGAAGAVLAALRAATSRPVVLVPAPLPTPGVDRQLPAFGAPWAREPGFVRHGTAVLADVLRALPAAVALQPEDTIEDEIFTAREHGWDGDTIHMNGAFGRLMWERIVAALEVARPLRRG